MDREKFKRYKDLFQKLYSTGDIEVEWSEEPPGVVSKIDLESILPKIDESLSEKEFINFTFMVINVLKATALGTEFDKNISDENISLIQEFFLQSEDFVDYISVRSSPNVNLLENIDYEIITKRSKNVPENILAYSALISIVSKSPISELKHMSLELSKNEIKGIIVQLKKALKDIEILQKNKG